MGYKGNGDSIMMTAVEEREVGKIFIRRLIPNKPEVSETKLPQATEEALIRKIQKTSAKATQRRKIRRYNEAMEVVRGEKKDTGKRDD